MSSIDSNNPSGISLNDNSLQMDIDDSSTANHNQNNESTNTDSNLHNKESDAFISRGGQALIDFLQNLEDYRPTVPDSVTIHIMNSVGFDTSDPRILRMSSLAAQKFIADIANDALQHCKMRTAISQNKKAPKDKRYALTFEDLVPVLSEYGIKIKKPPYFY